MSSWSIYHRSNLVGIKLLFFKQIFAAKWPDTMVILMGSQSQVTGLLEPSWWTPSSRRRTRTTLVGARDHGRRFWSIRVLLASRTQWTYQQQICKEDWSIMMICDMCSFCCGWINIDMSRTRFSQLGQEQSSQPSQPPPLPPPESPPEAGWAA